MVMMPGQRDHGLPGGQHGMIVGLDDGLAERPVVQVGRAVAGQQPVGLGQVGVAEQVPTGSGSPDGVSSSAWLAG